jgi:hypothetical protein
MCRGGGFNFSQDNINFTSGASDGDASDGGASPSDDGASPNGGGANAGASDGPNAPARA